MNEKIHPTAIIHDGAEIGENVEVGPYCIVGENVSIGEGTKLFSHVVIEGHTKIGKNNIFYQFSSIGVPPQDKSYSGEPTQTIIGDSNLFRENCTVHRATTKQDKITQIGNHGYFMTGVHFAHDCSIGDYVQMGGACGVTPFCNIGKGAFIGAASAIDKDIPHYCAAFGNRIKLKGVNIIGMRRRGHTKEEISEVVEFYRMMEASALAPRAFVNHPENIEEYKNNKVVQEIISFISVSEIGLPPFMS